MARQIFIVNANIVDANGNHSIPSGYPKSFDSKNYNNDVDKAQRRAESDFYGLLEGLTRMYCARVWNCCDASGKMDHEWSALSDIFQRVCEERGVKR